MEAFVTGSRKYGTPTSESDIDLVVFFDQEHEYDLLCDLAEERGNVTCIEEYEGLVLTPLRFGKLNLICCIQRDEWQCWRDGTKQLVDQKPVTRDQAIALLQKLRVERGLRKES